MCAPGLLAEERPLVSWINLGEVHYVLRRAHGEGAALWTGDPELLIEQSTWSWLDLRAAG